MVTTTIATVAKHGTRTFQQRQRTQDQLDIWYTPLPLDVMWGIYARQSTQAQLIKNAESTEMQTDDLIQWLIVKGVQDGHWQLFDADLGVSGTLRIDQRTGLQELVELIKADVIKAVLVYQISRLFRDDTGIQYNVFADICKQHNCLLVTADGMVFNFNNRTHMQMFRFLAQYAAEYIPQQIGLLHAARLRKARRGLYAGLGIVPSGYIVDYNQDNETYKKPILYMPHAERVMQFLDRYYAYDGHMGYLCRELDKLLYLFPPFESWVDRRNISRWKKRALPGGGYTISRKGLELLLCNPFLLGWLIVEGEIISRDSHAHLVDREHEYQFWYAFNGLSEYTINGEKNDKRERRARRFYQGATIEEAGLLKDRIQAEGYNIYVHYNKHYALIPEASSALVQSIGHDLDIRTIDQAFETLFFAHMRQTHDFDLFRKWVHEVIQKQTSLVASITSQLAEIDNQQDDILDQTLAVRRRINEQIKQALQEDPNADSEQLQARFEKEAEPEFERLRRRSQKLDATAIELRVKLPTAEENEEYTTARTFADFQTELERLIDVWEKKPFAARKEFVNLCVTNAVITICAPHWIELTIFWKHPLWETDTLYIRRKHGNKEAWTEDEKALIRETYATAPREDLLVSLPQKGWGCIVAQAGNLGIRRAVQPTPRLFTDTLSWLDWLFMQEHGIEPDQAVVPATACTECLISSRHSR